MAWMEEVRRPRNFDNPRTEISVFSRISWQVFRIFLSFSPGNWRVRLVELIRNPKTLYSGKGLTGTCCS